MQPPEGTNDKAESASIAVVSRSENPLASKVAWRALQNLLQLGSLVSPRFGRSLQNKKAPSSFRKGKPKSCN